MRRFLLWLERLRDKYSRLPLRELTCHGNFRAEYSNGEHTYWMDYWSAANLVSVFGGRVVHRNQIAHQGREQGAGE